MKYTTIVRRRVRRLGFSSLGLLIGLGLTLLLAGCGDGGSGSVPGDNVPGDNGPGGNVPVACDVNTASADCDNDGVLNED